MCCQCQCTPFGTPVVPDVYEMVATPLGRGGWCGRGSWPPARSTSSSATMRTSGRALPVGSGTPSDPQTTCTAAEPSGRLHSPGRARGAAAIRPDPPPGCADPAECAAPSWSGALARQGDITQILAAWSAPRQAPPRAEPLQSPSLRSDTHHITGTIGQSRTQQRAQDRAKDKTRTTREEQPGGRRGW